MRRRTPFTTHCAEMFGDIFICQFPFISGAVTKIRPALVLFDLEQDAIICRVIRASQCSAPAFRRTTQI